MNASHVVSDSQREETGRLTPARRAAALVILLFVTAAAYRGVIGNGFVYDDRTAVVKNPAVRSLARAPEWVLSPYAVAAYRRGANLRPVTVASYALDYALWGERAAGFHAMNLAIHLTVVVLVYVLALRLWGGDLSALVAAGWMALHPINAQAVNYVSARSSTLAAVGVLAAVWCYDRWAAGRAYAGGRGGRSWMAGAVVAGAFALGAKESAAVLPLLILVWDRARFGDTASWRASVTRSAPFWGLVGVWLLFRAAVLAGGASEHGVSAAWLLQGAAFGGKIVATAAAHSIWPSGLAIDYGWPMALPAGGAVAAAAGVALVIAGIGWMARLDRAAAWCGAWFMVALAPTLALPLITRLALYQEHRVYLAEIGAAWLVGGLLHRAAQWAGARTALRGAGAAGVIALAAVAAWVDGERTWVWGGTVRLWADALARYPDSALGRAERGTWLVNDGRLDDAEREFLSVLQSMPAYSYAHMMLGTIYAKRGEPARAIAAYRTALEFQARYAEARIRLGLVYEDLGWMDQALSEYERAIDDDPWASPAVILSASILDARGRTDEAIQRLRRIAPDDPAFDEAQIRLGALLVKQGRWADARDTLTAVLVRRPDSAEARGFLDAAVTGANRRDPLSAGSRGAPR